MTRSGRIAHTVRVLHGIPVIVAIALSQAGMLANAFAEGTAPAPHAEARQALEAARQAYDRGRFDVALAEFERSYAIAPHPSLLFNIGRAAEQDAQYERALSAYERFLAAVPQAEEREFVESRLKKLRALVRTDAGRPAGAASTDRPAADGVNTAVREVPAPESLSSSDQAARASESKRGEPRELLLLELSEARTSERQARTGMVTGLTLGALMLVSGGVLIAVDSETLGPLAGYPLVAGGGVGALLGLIYLGVRSSRGERVRELEQRLGVVLSRPDGMMALSAPHL